MSVLERNWQISGIWDQSLWDAMLGNHDKLRPDLIQGVYNITWGKLDCRVFAEDGRKSQGQHAVCDGSKQIYTWHLTYLPLQSKLKVLTGTE